MPDSLAESWSIPKTKVDFPEEPVVFALTADAEPSNSNKPWI